MVISPGLETTRAAWSAGPVRCTIQSVAAAPTAGSTARPAAVVPPSGRLMSEAARGTPSRERTSIPKRPASAMRPEPRSTTCRWRPRRVTRQGSTKVPAASGRTSTSSSVVPAPGFITTTDEVTPHSLEAPGRNRRSEVSGRPGVTTRPVLPPVSEVGRSATCRRATTSWPTRASTLVDTTAESGISSFRSNTARDRPATTTPLVSRVSRRPRSPMKRRSATAGALNGL